MRFTKFLLGLTISGAIIFGGAAAYKTYQRHQAEQAAKAAAEQRAAEERAAAKRMSTLGAKLSTIVSSADVSASVSVIDLKSGKSTQAGLDVVFRAASTTKVLSVAAYMHEVTEGKATLDTIIGGSKAQRLLERMLRDSDNNAWAAIDDHIGTDVITAYAQSIGITSYGSRNNVITANDMALLMQKLYQNKLMSKADTRLILSFMQDTNNEELIPAALPVGATVYHKFGLYEGELHDAAIISYKGDTYALVIFTNDERNILSDEPARIALIHELTDAAIASMH